MLVVATVECAVEKLVMIVNRSVYQAWKFDISEQTSVTNLISIFF
jgi:hypothetical protein